MSRDPRGLQAITLFLQTATICLASACSGDEEIKQSFTLDAGLQDNPLLDAALNAADASLDAADPTQFAGRRNYWTDWSSFEYEGDGGGTASGSILAASFRVDVTYSGELYGAQVDGGSDVWLPEQPYRSALVGNGPPGSDALKLLGVGLSPRELVFSRPLLDPVIAITSLGNLDFPASCQFEQPFELVSQGMGRWGNGLLEALPNNVLMGRESSGLIRFRGSHSVIRWTEPLAEGNEGWQALTLGVPDPGDGWDAGAP